MMIYLPILLACAPHTSPNSPKPADPNAQTHPETGPPATSTTTTTTTVESPGDTAALAADWTPADPMPPSFALSGMKAKQVRVVPDATGDGVADLYVRTTSGCYLQPGPITASSAFDTSIQMGSASDPGTFTDMNGDGIADYWLFDGLYFGPFTDSISEPDVTIRGMQHSVSGFDADKDGHLDVAFVDSWLDLFVVYGPFLEDRNLEAEEGGLDLTEITHFIGDQSCYGARVELLGPLNDEDEVILATAAWEATTCNPSGYLFDVQGPRGRLLTKADAHFEFDTDYTEVFAGYDFDGDGLNSAVEFDYIIRGTASSHFSSTVTHAFSDDMGGAIPVADVSGDGLADIVGDIQWTNEDGEDVLGWILGEGTKADYPNIRAHGVYIADRSLWADTFVAGDITGDGVNDLVGWEQAGYATDIRIWDGVAIREAFEAMNHRSTP